MDAHYKTLQTIFNIVKEDPQPTTYKCRPREIILRQFQDWSIIQQHLQLLEAEQLIFTRQEETLAILITTAGINKVSNESLASPAELPGTRIGKGCWAENENPAGKYGRRN